MNTIVKRFLVPFILMPPIALSLAEDKPAPQSTVQREAAIKKFLPTSDKNEHNLINLNNVYMAKELAGRASIDPLLQDTEKLRAKLKETIKTQKHAYTDVLVKHNGRPDAVDSLSRSQLIRISILMDDLLNGDLVNDIGKIIDSTEKNKEAGGLVLIKEGKVHFKALPNASTGINSPQFNANYLFPDDSFKEANAFLFHTHPFIKGQGSSNGPSWNMQASRLGVSITGDTGVALAMSKQYGETHHLVISTVGDPVVRKFNIDYFGGEATNAKEPKNQFDTESLLEHITILDLGIFKY
jgi:hypothetical protein